MVFQELAMIAAYSSYSITGRTLLTPAFALAKSCITRPARLLLSSAASGYNFLCCIVEVMLHVFSGELLMRGLIDSARKFGVVVRHSIPLVVLDIVEKLSSVEVVVTTAFAVDCDVNTSKNWSNHGWFARAYADEKLRTRMN